MSRTSARAASVFLLLVLLGFRLAGHAQGTTPRAARPAATPPRSGAFVASTKNGDWPSYTGDTRGSRYSPLEQITAANFNDLEVAWRFKTDNLGSRPEYKLEGTPIVVGGILYTTAGTRRSVIALDAATGELIWVHRYPEGRARRQRAAPALGPRPRLLDRRQGRRAHHLRHARLSPDRARREDRASRSRPSARTASSISRSAWSIGDGKPIDLETGEIGLHSTPTVVERHHPGRLGDEGRDDRPDSQQHQGAGARVRRAHRQADLDVPHDPQARRGGRRHLAEQLVGDQRQHRRVDADHRRRGARPRLPARSSRRPPTTTAASVRATTSIGESLVCVDLQTGKTKWHFQFVHHPIWDHDMSSAPLIADVTIDGRPRKVVAVPSKQAWLYVFDRVTGEPIWPIEEKPVPKGDVPGEWYSPTQPHPPAALMYGRNSVHFPDDLIDFTPELRAQAEKQIAALSLSATTSSTCRRWSATSTACSARSRWAPPTAAPTGRAAATIRRRTPCSRWRRRRRSPRNRSRLRRPASPNRVSGGRRRPGVPRASRRRHRHLRRRAAAAGPRRGSRRGGTRQLRRGPHAAPGGGAAPPRRRRTRACGGGRRWRRRRRRADRPGAVDPEAAIRRARGDRSRARARSSGACRTARRRTRSAITRC